MERILITGLLFSILSSAQAFDIVLDGTGTSATGITGLEIDPGSGELWDVTWEFVSDHDGSPADCRDIFAYSDPCPPATAFENEAGATVAVNVINQALGTVDVSPADLTVGESGSAVSDVYYVPYLYNHSNCAPPGPDNGTCVIKGDGFDGLWGMLPAISNEISLTSPVQIAKFTAHVPVPPAVWLFGSALGLLGWVRHRSRQQST